MNKKTELLFVISLFTGAIILLFITYPIINTFSLTKPALILEALQDREVLQSIYISMGAAAITTFISFLLGVPFAYFLARKDFKGKSLIESIIDVPIVIPHTVAGICLLTVLSPRCWFGRMLTNLGIEVLGTIAAIVIAMTFVSMPFLINTAKESFKWVSPRLENVSRTLGATHAQTFFLITFSLSWRDILGGMILTWARAISEFGAVIILAYHPMIAPTLIYERFTCYGMIYAVPVTAILIIISLIIFIILRIIASGRKEEIF
ncbi:MAG: ABC transporter permease [Thermosyntropha sp.]|nr:ABC transporter permease [Thermosyntropha sp.]